MKKYLSVFMLIARCSIYKVFGLLILMAGCEFLAFSYGLSSADGGLNGLENAFEAGFCEYIFVTSCVVLLLLLSRMGASKSSKTIYTLNRLSVSEKCVFWIESLYDTLCIIILWLSQALLSIGLCYYYILIAGSESTAEQTMFLAFFRSDFLLSLLPFDEPFLLISNYLLALSLGISTARLAWADRNDKPSNAIMSFAYIGYNFFFREVGSLWQSVIICIISAMVIVEAIYFTFKKEAEDEN